mgnify:CR=1 FL=1
MDKFNFKAIEGLFTLFWDKENGAFFFTPKDAKHLITRTRNAFDNATPAGNGTMTENLATLYYLTGNDDYRVQAQKTIDVFARQPSSQYINMTSILNGFERLTTAIQITLFGELEAPETTAMKAAAHSTGYPDLILSLIPPGRKLPPKHPAVGKERMDGMVTAYVCVGTTCSPPVTTPEGLKSTVIKT